MLYKCYFFAVGTLFYMLFSISKFLCQNSYLSFYVYTVHINSINGYILFLFPLSHNLHCQDGFESSKHKQRFVDGFDILRTITTIILCWCWFLASGGFFYIVSSMGTYSYQNSYSYFYVYIVLINSIVHYFIILIIQSDNRHR